MPLVKRSEPDILVNPVNAAGRMDAGLAKAFADRWPAMVEDYKSLCDQSVLGVGDLHVYHDAKSHNTIINMLVKRDWCDGTTVEAIEMGCAKLADYLRQHPYHTVAMPAFGTGSGRLDPVFAEDVLIRHLEPLPNIIHLSMRPDRFERPPIYVAVVGSRAYTDYLKIDFGVSEGLLEFGLKYEDVTAMVSGGAKGVDKVACGSGRPGDNEPNFAREHGIRPIVCQADWDRYGNSAGFVRNRMVADIATHVIAFVGSKSTGTRMLLELVNKHNASVDAVLSSYVAPTDGAVFDHPYVPLPQKKPIYVCDVSKESV